jgi:hypothetical protein
MPNRLVARVYAAVLPGKRRVCRLDELPAPGTLMELWQRSKRLPMVGFCILYSLALSTIIIFGYCLVPSTWHCGIELAPCHSREVVPLQ